MSAETRVAAADGLPSYVLRESGRARRVRLTVSARDGLVVVVPAGFRGALRPLLLERAPWIERALARVAERRELLLAGPDALLPSEVDLPLLGGRFRVEYVAAPGRTLARVDGPALVVRGDVADASACLGALGRFADRAARELLLPLLAEEAAACGITVTGVRVARQRTRWGSCSARGTISLNRNLVFLPERLVRSLIRHELAHRLVLDHSPRFWATLERIDPGAREARSALKRAGALVPAWAEA